MINTVAQGVRDKFFITHDTIFRKKDLKAVSGEIQIPPLLRQRHNATLG